MAYMQSRICDHHEAQDLVQEVLLRIFRAVRQGAMQISQGSLAPWIFTIASHCLIDHVRKNRSHPMRLVGEQTLESTHTKTPDKPIVRAELVELVREALDGLPVLQAEVIRLKIYGGLKLKEVAEIQQYALSTVKSRMCYGLQKLNETLSVTAGEDYERFLSH
jgi:RNA polymerase sigma-70 factor (ECF subfamily)